MDIWKLSMRLVEGIYQTTDRLPESEKFGLTSQMRRAAVSIPSNIAEGASRKSDKEFYRFLCFSRGSLMELETQLLICMRLGYIETNREQEELIEHIFAKINALMHNLNSR
ncbi:MAG: four helix bundle protein [Oleiphilus sp.]|nr:MAG: four helix bundle protein [Oleiphilus sp.]